VSLQHLPQFCLQREQKDITNAWNQEIKNHHLSKIITEIDR
jgi:hypothetical protein